MFPDRQDEMKPWIDVIKKAIAGSGSGGSSSSSSSSSHSNGPSSDHSTSSSSKPAQSNNQQSTQAHSQQKFHPPAGPIRDMSPRDRLNLAKQAVSFLKDQDSKVLEFWNIWSESIPSREDLTAGSNIEFQVATTADMQKLTWRTSGPQNIFIQKMVDFFWNVGAPESEIDRLNDVGALINPLRIGSWIDMSAKGNSIQVIQLS